MIGLFDCDTDAAPRIRMRAPAPLAPLDGRIDTPGTRAASASDGFWIGALRRSSVFTLAIVLPSFFAAVAPPVPVTTTSSSCSADCVSAMSTRAVCSTVSETA